MHIPLKAGGAKKPDKSADATKLVLFPVLSITDTILTALRLNTVVCHTVFLIQNKPFAP